MSALRLLLLSALAASASGYIPTLSGPVRAAEAHERGGLSPFHFKWGRRQRRELGAEPSYSGDQLRALLNASGGSYTAAVQRARSGAATELL